MANFVDDNKQSNKQSYLMNNDDGNLNSAQDRGTSDKTLDFKNKNL